MWWHAEPRVCGCRLPPGDEPRAVSYTHLAGPVIVGAIAEQLVRLSPCPVLAVAADWNAGEFRPTPGGPVLLAMERNEATLAAVGTAYSLAETFHRTLIVLHARGPAEASAFLNPCLLYTSSQLRETREPRPAGP